MKPGHIGNAHFSYSASSDANVAGTSSRQQQSSETASQEQVNPALQGLTSASRSRRVSFGSWVGVQGESRPVGLDSRGKHEKYPGSKYKASAENREMKISDNAHKSAANSYDMLHGSPLSKSDRKGYESGNFARIDGDKKERKKEGKMALQQYEYFRRDAADPEVNYEHKTLRPPRGERERLLRELKSAEKERGGASNSGS
ncbi:type III effector protein XopW [Xanthomonas prunicola]|uniref:Type III effector protein XopW n=1 Tax=Xanthomonas prunicola TaxID=2053930 RepID=A0A9Q9MTZ2_9XANT|nr:type III secretion system effector XopW [Xanthomonas prunicola]USJ02062.1 type III effector protein XopW [Xanthomonas prunicola]UXA50561.1 type III effector protein XopW [Xanthomonas prunicola]UXA58870.1 type III effector protein XopW [Xanthomonas prunicola]UXA61009.1 type III effector protein XopW [Xanthomonas prunicola]UXA67079.1 type III effector protein XopW [Xanthomonas prunicola]